MRKINFNRDTTNFIKGIMLIFMFVLHFFCFPSWNISNVTYSKFLWMEKYQAHFQICIAGFTFLSGYFYFFCKNKNFKYIIKKWLDLLIPYWIIFMFLFLLAIVTCSYTGNAKIFLLELLGLNRPVMYFCWYVPFYIIMMLFLYIVDKLNYNSLISEFIAITFSLLLYYLIRSFVHIDYISSLFEKNSVYFPITVIGYLCAKNGIFEEIDKFVQTKNNNIKLLIAVFLFIITFMEPTWLYAYNLNNIFFIMFRKCIRIISIPFFIYSIVLIHKSYYKNVINKIIQYIGKYSMEMWFIHCIFFNCSKKIFQKFLFISKYPIVVLIWGLFLCLIFSIPLKYLSLKIRKKINI